MYIIISFLKIKLFCSNKIIIQNKLNQKIFIQKGVKNMLSTTKTIALHGLEGFLIDVQVDISSGMPSWDIVGLPDASIKEAKERVRTAIKNSGYELFSRKIVINLAPANIKKEGSIFDLPMAVGILRSIEIIYQENMENTLLIGELSLNGNLNPMNGALPICIEAKRLGIKKIIMPQQNVKEASIISGIEIIGVSSLKQVVKYLNGDIHIPNTQTSWEECIKQGQNYLLDFSEVKGQENVKRAIEIAAAGSHNCLLIGSPGSRQNHASKKNTIYFTKLKL